MRGHNRWLLAAGLAIGTLGMASIANAQAALDTTFSYQGQLKSGLNLVEVNSDFRFTVWDAAAAGAQIAGPVTRSNVLVRDGVFTVSLDFGAAPFDGSNRFLQIEVRSPAGVGAFTTLTPRQKMQATPYAQQAQSGNAPFVVKAPGSTNNITVNPENSFYTGGTTSTFGGKLAQATGGVNGGAGVIANFNLAQGTLSTVMGADQASGSGFLQLGERDGVSLFGTIFLNADDDRNDANGIYEGALNLFSRGTGGTGGIVRLRNNDNGLTLEGRGGVSAGGANINFFNAASGKSVISFTENIGGSKPGGRLSASRPDGTPFFFMEPDVDGTGGFFFVNGGSGGFSVDGNGSGAATGGPRVSINGPTSGMSFDTNAAGDGSVNLPVDAINATEILDEPGVANIHVGNTAIPASGVGTLASRTITVPGPGFVVVLANGDIAINHTLGTTSNYAYGVSNIATSIPVDQDIQSVVQTHEPTNFYDYSAAAHGLFTVPSAGSYTYYFNAQKFSGAGTATMFDVNLTVMYFPTAYGVTQTNFTGGFAPNTGNSGPAFGPMTGDQLAGERAQGEQFGRDRAMAELAQMQARIQQLQKMIGNGPAAPAAVAPAKKLDTRPAVEPVAINNSEGK